MQHNVFQNTYGINKVANLDFIFFLYTKTLKISTSLKNKYPDITKKQGTHMLHKTEDI